MVRHTMMLNSTTEGIQVHKKSFQNLGIRSNLNPMKSFHPFISLRVQVTTNDLGEMNEKLSVLLKSLEEIYVKIDEEQML